MASPSMPKRGRPKLNVEVRRICLRMDVYNPRLVQKNLVGMGDKSHGDFARHLLEIHEEIRALRSGNQLSSPQAINLGESVYLYIEVRVLYIIFTILFSLKYFHI